MHTPLEPFVLSNESQTNKLDPFYNQQISQFALENSNIGIWDYHVESNKLYYSREAKNILGYDNQEYDASKLNWQEKIHPDDLDLLLIKLESHFSGKSQEYVSEHRMLSKDGTYKWVKDIGKVVERDANGNHLRVIGTITDITPSKLREEDMSLNIDIMTNQNQKLTNFAHIVTHNLKNHAGNFESLLSFYNDEESEDEKKILIEHLKTVSDSLTKTIGNLSEIVTSQSIKKIARKNLNIHHYIENTIKLLDLETAEKKAVFNNRVDKKINLYCNSAYLESIILNLASNALKYSHPERQPIINIGSTLENNLLTITVTDNGVGIDLDKHGHKLFGLYKTFHGNENAEGVGLYLTKNQIETLGGSIDVSSQVDVGTSFTITIKL